MSEYALAAFVALGMALINMVGSVLLTLIRAKYKWTNGTERPANGEKK